MASTKQASSASFEGIIKDINARKFEKVYFLEGVESYFIDKIAETLSKTVLTNDEKAFNYFTYYGADADVGDIVNTAKSYPLNASHLLIEIREAQLLSNLEDLAYYLQRPLDTTILVVCYKNGTYDRRKRLAMLAQKNGVLFEAKKMTDSQLVGYIEIYLKQHNISIGTKAEEMLAGYVGADLNRLNGELDKLIIAMPQGQREVTPELVEKNVGISKDFNYFELQDAIVSKDVYKAVQIVQYFGANSKNNPLQATLVMLFRFFSKLMVAYYSPDKSLQGMAAWLGMPEWQVRKNILTAKGNYSARKVMEIIEKIREIDERQKGIGYDSEDEADLGIELIHFILN